jgi:hypothetical protein
MGDTIQNQQILKRILRLTLDEIISTGHHKGLGSKEHLESIQKQYHGKLSIFHHFMTMVVLNSNNFVDFGITYKKCWQRTFAIAFLAEQIMDHKMAYSMLHKVDWKRYKYHYTPVEVIQIKKKQKQIKDEYWFVFNLYINATQ